MWIYKPIITVGDIYHVSLETNKAGQRKKKKRKSTHLTKKKCYLLRRRDMEHEESESRKRFQDRGNLSCISSQEEGPLELWFSILSAQQNHQGELLTTLCPGHNPIQSNQISRWGSDFGIFKSSNMQPKLTTTGQGRETEDVGERQDWLCNLWSKGKLEM